MKSMKLNWTPGGYMADYIGFSNVRRRERAANVAFIQPEILRATAALS